MIRARVLPNVSVLNTLGEVSTKNEILLRAYNWFLKDLKPQVRPDTVLKENTAAMIFDDDKMKKLLTDLMRKADFNIESIIAEDEYNYKETITINPYTVIFFNDNKIKKRILSFCHSVVEGEETKIYALDDELESRGTWRYFGLAGSLLKVLQNDMILFIDELDSSLHPDLLNYFYSMFLVNSKRAQIIFTIHNRELLEDKELCRRDTIWFTEKQKDGSTELYSIADLNGIRKDQSFEGLYKAGKLGAIPKLGNLFLELENDED
jgi:hypothetical protein